MAKKKTIKNSEIKFSKKIIILMFATMIIFTSIMIIIFCKFQTVPDTLIENFFGFFCAEGGALGIIKVAETISEKMKKGKK